MTTSLNFEKSFKKSKENVPLIYENGVENGVTAALDNYWDLYTKSETPPDFTMMYHQVFENEYNSAWDRFQNGGNRTDYNGLTKDENDNNIPRFNSFAGWESRYIKPKYPLMPVNPYAMFFECKNLLVAPDVDFVVSTNVTSVFNGCPNLKKVGKIECNNIVSAGYLFTNDTSLETIEYINLPNATNFHTSFHFCHNLKNIRFAENSIQAGDINFRFCQLLTADSIESIVLGLNDKAKGKSITLPLGADVTYNAARPELADTENGLTPFDVLVSNRPYWTISISTY